MRVDPELISRRAGDTGQAGGATLRLAQAPDCKAGADDLLRRLDHILSRASEAAQPHPANGNVGEAAIDAARSELAARRAREQVFGASIPSEPAWDILLQLFVAGEEGRPVSVFAVCADLAAPEPTMFRCVAHLAGLGLVVRHPQATDPRSIYLMLSQAAKARMCDYFTRSAAG